MTRRTLFLALCRIATTLDEEAQRGPYTAHTCVLLGLVGALDALIDAVVDAPAPEDWRWCDDEGGDHA